MVRKGIRKKFRWADLASGNTAPLGAMSDGFIAAAEQLLPDKHFLLSNQNCRRELQKAGWVYYFRTHPLFDFRRKDIAKIAEELRRLKEELDVIGSALLWAKLFDNNRLKLTNTIAISDQVDKAKCELGNLVWIAEELLQEIDTHFGRNDSGPIPLSAKMRGDPLDEFTMDVARLWTAEGRSLYGAEASKFHDLICLLLEALTGKEVDALPDINARLQRVRAATKSSGENHQ